MSFQVEYFTVDSTVISNQYVDLQLGEPADADNVAMDLVGGTAQSLNGDFAVDGTRIRWDSVSYGLYNMVDSTDDRIRILYDRS